jgi:nicotinamidase-related amidase
MHQSTYDPARTGLLFVDPDNDFVSEGGERWPRVREVADATATFSQDMMHAVHKLNGPT